MNFWLDVRDPVLRQALSDTWDRLPLEAQLRVQHIPIIETGAIKAVDGSNGWGQAGPTDILLRPGAPTHAAAVGIVTHELAHCYLDHPRRLESGRITRQQAEREADMQAERWGFGAELAQRRALIGR